MTIPLLSRIAVTGWLAATTRALIPSTADVTVEVSRREADSACHKISLPDAPSDAPTRPPADIARVATCFGED